MSATNADELRAVMAEYWGGSDGRYRHALNRKLIYTEGVKAAADKAGCYWLLDIVATEVMAVMVHSEWNAVLHVHVYGGKAHLQLDIADEKSWEKDIDLTDFPEGQWMFYLEHDRIVDFPAKVVVMLLPEEH